MNTENRTENAIWQYKFDLNKNKEKQFKPSAMFQFKEEVIKDIIECEDPNKVVSYINDEIVTMKQKGFINLVIMRFIQKLDMALVSLKNQNPAVCESSNFQFARKTLLNKILHGVDA